MARRRISLAKQVHEVERYLRGVRDGLYRFAAAYEAQAQTPTVRIARDATGEIWLPSRAVYEHLQPTSPPAGMIFPNGAFLVFKEILRFGYPDATTSKPVIYRLEYSYHFQHPARFLFFRFDHHPTKGDPRTHPLHHLVAGPCLPQERTLPTVPRFKVNAVSLVDVLATLVMNEELLQP